MVKLINALKGDYVLFKRSQTHQYLKEFKTFRVIKHAISRGYRKVIPYSFRLHGDPMLQRIFVLLGNELNATSIVETGTYYGASTSFIAERFPKVPIYTCEINNKHYRKGKRNLGKFKNVKVYKETSPKFLKSILEQDILGDKPIFFLDAHWWNYWPLEDEMKLITEKCKHAVIIIDDFKVPGDDKFKFDYYKDKECSLDLIRPMMNKKNKYNVLFPHYGVEDFEKGRYYPDPTGYPILFQNMGPEFKSLLANPFIKKYFVDRSLLL